MVKLSYMYSHQIAAFDSIKLVQERQMTDRQTHRLTTLIMI